MQDKYVGDIGDFGKLLLLRSLIRDTKLSVGVVWCVVKDSSENNNDGSIRAYRTYSGSHSLRHCDPELFDDFKLFEQEENRQIVRLHPLIPASVFFNEPANGMPRETYLAQALETTENVELIFFDPDNGIDFNASNAAISSKHIGIEELGHFWKRNQSLLVYHHLSRAKGGHDKEKARAIANIAEQLPGAIVREYHFRRGTSRVFFLIIQSIHLSRFPDAKSLQSWHPLTMRKKEWARLKMDRTPVRLSVDPAVELPHFESKHARHDHAQYLQELKRAS